MENEQSCDEMFEKFKLKFENISRLKLMNNKVYSEPFVLGGYPWNIALYEWGQIVAELSIFLSAVQTANMSIGWSRHVKFRFVICNQVDSNRTITSDVKFTARDSSWGIASIVSLTELRNPHSGFLVNDVCIIGVHVLIYKIENEKLVNKIECREVEVTRPKMEDSEGQNECDLIDWTCLGQIEKAFIPLLKEVCSLHPSLILCQKNKTHKFRGWAYNALGRVLYFLKTKKVKNMNDLACKQLQIFWEELEAFGFDLTWLEPHVQSALTMKSYLEKLKEVEKLRDNVVTLELEMERLTAKIATVKVNLDEARYLLEVENFVEIGLDAELGFVKP